MVSQLISTELMLVNQTDKSQKMIMRAMPIIFVIFLWNFPAGLFVYWVTTNLWTIGQQLLIRKVMKPKTAEELASRPAKRSRFMEAIASAGGKGTPQTREELVAQQRAEKAGTSGKANSRGNASGKAGAGGKAGGPGKAPAKSGQKPGGKGAGSGSAQAGSKKPAGQSGAQGSAGPGSGGQAAKKPAAQTSGRKPPPGKGKRKAAPQQGQQGRSSDSPAQPGGAEPGAAQRPAGGGDSTAQGQGTDTTETAGG